MDKNYWFAGKVDVPTPNDAIQAGPSTSGTQSIRRRRTTVKKKKRNVKKRKTARSRFVTKKYKSIVENEDGTITEEIWTKITRKRKKRKAVKRKKTSRVGSRGSRSCGTTGTSTSTRDRLERNLASVAADATSRRRASPAVASNLSRFSAGIPTLNIFEPRHELAPISSGSDEELGGGGEVGLLTRGRRARPRPIERSKAIELLRSAPSRPRAVPQACEGPSDLLSSILESQAIWHSKKSDVTIRNDGTVETSSNRVDVRSARPERVATAAPVFPGAGPGPYRPGGDNSTSPSSSQSRPAAATPAAAASSAGPRSAPVNDREGYSNFLNNLSLRPAPFCRGGPPLRIRMPVRPQLRRIPLVPRRRALYDEEDDVDEQGEKKEDGEDKNGANADEMSGEAGDDTDAGEKQEVDLYSDIEPNAERDVSESESVGQYSALGPPPEPPAFLLSMTSGEDKKSEKKDSDVYDPAEPCDSGDELVIDETPAAAPAVVPPLQPPPEPPAVLNDVLADSVDSSENSCPVLQLYSSDSVAFSHKDEDERAKALSSDKTNRTETDQLTHSMPVDDVSQEAKSPVCEKDLTEKDEGTPGVAKDRSPSPVKENSGSPSSSPSRRSRRSPSSSPSPMRTRKDSTHSQKSRSPASFTTKRRKRRSLKNDSSDDSDTSPRLSTRDRTKKDSKQNENELSTNGDNPRVSTGLEGLEVEEVSSDMEENDFNDSHLSSLSLSGISDHSRSSSPTMKKKKKKKRAKMKSKSKKTASEEGEIESDKEKPKKTSKKDRRTSDADKNGVSNRRPSKNRSPGRKVLSSQENKKINAEDEEGWKKMPTKGRNYRESRKSSKERGLSSEKKRGGSSSPKRDKKKSKDKKKSDKKKEIERYDVRKVVKEREHVRKDEFGRDLPVVSGSRSRTKSRSRSRSRGRGPARPPKRDASHSPARRAPRSPSRRRRRRRSVSRSPLSPRRNRRARRSSDRDGRKASRSRPRRSPSSSPSPRRNRNLGRSRKSRSPSISLSPAPRARDAYSPVRVIRRSISPAPIRSYVKAWSPNVTREKSLENLTVVLKSKDKKKRKKKKDERRELKSVESKRKKSGNSKEVFASGDNVLVSVNFSSKSNKSSNVIVIPDIPMREVSSKKKKKRMAMDNNERPAKKNRTVNTVTKSAVDNALSSEGLAMRKKVGRLTGEDAEEILKRKPVAVIDLDMSPYREQTPSPINVVVVSDSGSGDEGKGPAPGKPQQRPRSPEIVILPTPAPLTTSGPKTPPEPPLKFSISKGAQIRPIANPLAEPDDEGEEAAVENAGQAEESVEVTHKGPNTPPAPRGPSTPPRGPTTPPMMGPNTPRSLQSPQSSPDAYDPFEPTKSRSPSPGGLAADVPVDKPTVAESSSSIGPVVIVPSEEAPKHAESNEAVSQETPTVNSVTDVNSAKESSPIQVVDLVSASSANFNKTASVRKSTPQPMTPNAVTTLQAFSLPSPKTPNRTNSSTLVSGIHRLQHRLGSPVSKTPNSVKSTPEKRSNDTLLAPRSKRNGPVPDGSNETVDMDDSPYSPGSSEGDDLFDPPPAAAVSHPPPVATQATHKPTKPKATTTPVKAVSKFDQLFGSSVSPMKNGGKKTGRIPKTALPKVAGDKKAAKPAAGTPAKKSVASKMDEDQLRILDEVPSSAVELQVKDMFLKKLNRQERVVDEVKTVLKPHYAKKHITKEEYKQILRRAVPKICHSKSGEINPSKIQQLIEAYVRKYRQNKKKGGVQKPSKLMKSGMFS